jgi:hypothetical protein
MKDHRLIDERSLAFDRLIAEKLRQNPALINKARANLKRWMNTASPSAKPALREWQELLDGPTTKLFEVLEGTDERAVRLRQSSPFCGILTREERTRILLEFHARDTQPA